MFLVFLIPNNKGSLNINGHEELTLVQSAEPEATLISEATAFPG
jgi:hypothetical protein